MGNELIIARDLTVEIFDSKQTLEEIVQEVKEKVEDFKKSDIDVTTAKGRKEVTAFVTRIVKTKTGIESLGKEKKQEYKEICDKIDEGRRYAKTNFEKLQEEARKPLTEYEEKEKARRAAHEDNIKLIKDSLNTCYSWQDMDMDKLKGCYQGLINMRDTKDFEEYQDLAMSTFEEVIPQVKGFIEAKEIYEKEQAELAELRKQAELQRQKDHEEKIRKQAAEEAKLEAEKALQRERDKAEAAAKAAELRIQEERERAEREKAEYERNIKEAEERRLAEIEAEKQRLAREEKAKADAEAARQKDEEYRLKIKGEIRESLKSLGLDDKACVNVITAIFDGEIPHVKVIY